MNQRHANTAIQIQKMHAKGVHDVSMLQFNYKLIPSPTSHSLILPYYNVLLQEFYAAIFLCPHDIFHRGFCCYITHFGTSDATFLFENNRRTRQGAPIEI